MRVVTIEGDSLWLYEPESTESTLLDSFAEPPSCLAVDSTGSLVATGTSDGSRDVYMSTIPGAASDRRITWQRTSVHLERDKKRTNNRASASVVSCIAFSPAGTSLAAGFADGRVLTVPFSMPWCTTELEPHNREVTAVAEARNGSWLATASRDGTVRVTVRDTSERFCLSHPSAVTALRVNPDESWIATTAGTHLYIWDARTGTPLHALREHSRPIRALAISPNGTWIATAASDRTVRIWDTSRWQSEIRVTAKQPLVDIAISPDGETVATRDTEGEVAFWDVATGGYHGFTWEHYVGPGITKIIVEFSGCADEGDVTDVTFVNDKGEVLGSDNPDLYVDYLPDGFELNNGSYGTVEIDCESGEISEDDVMWREDEEDDEAEDEDDQDNDETDAEDDDADDNSDDDEE
jgi:WD40 repeat protein